MKALRLPFALLATGFAFSGAPDPLRVLRTSPTAEASAGDTVTITFDRPVAGSLDNAVDARALVRIEPAPANGAGLDWRDPVTLRIVPRPAFRRGIRYVVTVSDSFHAMDGSQLAAPFRLSFRVRGPTLTGGDPVSGRDTARHIAARPRFTLRFDAPVRPSDVAALSHVELTRRCTPTATAGNSVALAPVGQDNEPRREVALQAQSELPLDCVATLVTPRELEEGATSPVARTLARWPFRVHGLFRIAGAECQGDVWCPTGGIVLRFSTPVRGRDLARAVKTVPAVALAFDTSETRAEWRLDATLKPRTMYAVVVDRTLHDVFDQSFTGNPAIAMHTTGFEPDVQAPYGRYLIERNAFRTFAVRTMNVDTLIVERLAVPEALEARFLSEGSWQWRQSWDSVPNLRVVQRIPVKRMPDQGRIVSIPIPMGDARQRGSATLQLVQVRDAHAKPDTTSDDGERGQPLALLQVTNLGVHAKIGDASGMVWVTGADDGKARAGAQVVLHDAHGAELARGTTDVQGLATLSNYAWRRPATDDDEQPAEGYVAVTLGDDRALLPVHDGDPDLAPWRFGLQSAWGATRAPQAGALFTERGIYRPGDVLYAKAIVRSGALGSLSAPAPRDSVRWVLRDRDYAPRSTAMAALSEFGTTDRAFEIPADAPLGDYTIDLEWQHRGRWTALANASYKIAEFRPPEFLTDIASVNAPRLPGDSLRARVSARYLFGAPMSGASLTWEVRRNTLSPYELTIPGLDDWLVGDGDDGWDRTQSPESRTDLLASGTDSLDASGQRALSVVARLAERGHPARLTLVATVTDVNRRTVGATTSSIVHPAEVYVAAKPDGASWFWTVGAARTIQVVTARPEGAHVSGVHVSGTLIRREWHRVRRTRDGITEQVGEWVADTVAHCDVTTADTPRPCALAPKAAGIHSVVFTARDAAGRSTITSFTRWVTGPGWVPYNDDGQFKLDVVADRKRYAPGDTATLLFASPFTDAEAWITVEREGLFEQRRLRLTSGTTTFKLPITEAHAPNVFVSMLVARGRSAPPGTLGDPGRPTVRVGYAELRVTPEVKRLSVQVSPDRSEYRPGDSARVALNVHDARGRGVKAEVTMWAVDEGVLALTGYKTPDALDLLYRPRGVGMTLASLLVSVAPQVPEGEKGFRESGGGGGRDGADVMRSQFRSTAFFLGSVVTDDTGHVVATAKLPDNLTTFRVMAVAVTRADRFGSGEAKLLVTRPLVARAALPRFLRAGDVVSAGTLVNLRSGGKASVTVDATAVGATIAGKSSQTVQVEAGHASEARFTIHALPVERATFRFGVRTTKERDAVETTIPMRADGRPTVNTAGGTFTDAGTLVVPMGARLDGSLDVTRSELALTLGASPLAVVRAAAIQARSYPYGCSEQVSSSALPLVALLAADRVAAPGAAPLAPATALRDVRAALSALANRQRSDGGIGYWASGDWTSPWLSAYAALLFADAKAAGITVDDSVVVRLGNYLQRAAGKALDPKSAATGFTPVSRFYDSQGVVLSEYVAAVDALSRLGRPNVAVENDLLRRAAQLTWEDRARLAMVLSRRSARATVRDAAIALLTPLWNSVRVDGRHAVLPDSAFIGSYFESHSRPAAYLLMATMPLSPDHALVAPLVETLVQANRGGANAFGATQEFAPAVMALSDFERRQHSAVQRGVRISVNGKVLLEVPPGRVARDTILSLSLLSSNANAGDSLRLTVSPLGAGPALYAVATLTAVPKVRPVAPVDRGIAVERWIETVDDRKPVTTVIAGTLVRVWVRVTVTSERRFVILDDPLPAGLEAVDLSLRTAPIASNASRPLTTPSSMDPLERPDEGSPLTQWGFGRWDSGWWSPFDHQELRDDRVVWGATVLWPGRYTVSYLARASTPGTFVRPPAHAEEMYDRAVFGRSDGGTFIVTAPTPTPIPTPPR